MEEFSFLSAAGAGYRAAPTCPGPRTNRQPRHRTAPPPPACHGGAGLMARQSAAAEHELSAEQWSMIQSLRSQLREYKARDRQLKSQLQLEQQIFALRRENKRLREAASASGAAALRRENAYLNEKTTELGLRLHAAEKALRQAEEDRRRLEGEVERLGG